MFRPRHVKQDAEPSYGASAMRPKVDADKLTLEQRVKSLEYQMEQLLKILGGK